MEQKPSISILGCGWYGFELAKNLVNSGYQVKGSTTTENKLGILAGVGIESFLIDFENDKNQFDLHFFESDILLISIPPKRSSPALIHYPKKIERILKATNVAKVKHVILISSTGVFHDGSFLVDENAIPTPDSDSGKMMLNAEKLLLNQISFTKTIIRFGGLIGPDRNLAKHFAGKQQIPNGLAPINLIHLNDCVGLTKTILEQYAFGHIYHGVMPDHPTRKDFYRSLCAKTGLMAPEFLDELLTWKQVKSINVPNMLNYRFLVADANELANLLIS